MRKILATLALATVATLSACSVNVTAGTVVDKQMEEAWSEEVEITEEECTLDYDTKKVNGKTVKYRDDDCEEVGTGEFETVEHDAVYKVTLEDKQGNDETHDVDKEVYDSVEVGDFLDLEATN